MDRERTIEETRLVEDAEVVRRARLNQVRSLSPTERVERLHELCAQLAAFRAGRDDVRP